MLFSLSAILVFVFFFELLRIKYKLLQDLTREHEKRKFAAYFYYTLAILLITTFFDKEACFSAVFCSNLGDGVAGIVKRFTNKNLGSFLMFISSLLASITFLSPLPSFAACFVATVVERVEKIGKFFVEDNFSVPISAAVTYTTIYFLTN